MECRAKNHKLGRQLTDPRLRIRTFGFNLSRKIAARIDEISAANTLSEISNFPPARLHQLTGDKNGLFAVDISVNYRLVFAGFNAAHQQTNDITKIVTVVFMAVEDYH